MAVRLKGSGGLVLLGMAALVGTGGCGSERDRPLEPGAGPAPPAPPARLVRILVPTPGAVVRKAVLTGQEGLEVVYGGRFIPGTRVDLEGLALQYGPVPFHTESFRVEEPILQRSSILKANRLHMARTRDVRLRLEVTDAFGTLLSVDSLDFRVR